VEYTGKSIRITTRLGVGRLTWANPAAAKLLALARGGRWL